MTLPRSTSKCRRAIARPPGPARARPSPAPVAPAVAMSRRRPRSRRRSERRPRWRRSRSCWPRRCASSGRTTTRAARWRSSTSTTPASRAGRSRPRRRWRGSRRCIQLRRHADALALLDRAAPSPHGSGRELLVARAELRAAAGRRAAAEADFNLLLRARRRPRFNHRARAVGPRRVSRGGRRHAGGAAGSAGLPGPVPGWTVRGLKPARRSSR